MTFTRGQFAQHLKLCSQAVRNNVNRFCWNELPEGDKYFIFLNCSYDGNPLAPGEYFFPDHDEPQTDQNVPRTGEEVVDRLWRDGKIPEWINITPHEIIDGFLHLQLKCCGRFTDNEDCIYHTKEGYPPFHVFGPILLPGCLTTEPFEKFDLHWYRDRAQNQKA